MSFFELLGGGVWKKISFGVVLSALAGLLYTACIKLVNDLLASDELQWLPIALLLGSITASLVLSIISGRMMTRFFEKKVAELRISLSKKIMRADYERVEKNSYRILPILQNDVNILIQFVKNIPDMVVAVFKILAIWVYMFWLSWQMTVFIVAVFLLVFLFNYLLLSRIYTKEVAIKYYHNEIHHSIEGMVLGLKDLSLNERHSNGYISNIIAPISFKHGESVTGLNTYNILLTKSAEWIVIVAIAAFTVIIKYYGFMEVSEINNFMTMIIFILPSLIVATSFIRGLKRVQVAVEQINSLGLEYQIQHQLTQSSEWENITLPGNSKGIINIKDLQYVYSNADNNYQLGPIDLDIYENEVLLIKGGNGSGKTTFSKLLAGLYQPTSGTISYKSTPVNRDNLVNYRDIFAAVFTDSFVFNNLSYLAGQPSKEQAEKYINQLALEEKISLDDWIISDVNLSYGQRGRINLLRSLLEDKPLYLFDEWAANQDPHFREKFYHEIIPMLKAKGKTVIIISHDEKYYQIADRIVTFQSGAVVDVVTN